eukprot:1051427-Pyramimonas_sp.AAC.1
MREQDGGIGRIGEWAWSRVVQKTTKGFWPFSASWGPWTCPWVVRRRSEAGQWVRSRPHGG